MIAKSLERKGRGDLKFYKFINKLTIYNKNEKVMAKKMQKKISCNHDWEKIRNLIEKRLFQEVIVEQKNIHVLDDLWLLIEAYIGLADFKEVEVLIDYWRFRISNLKQESYFLYYESIVLINKNLLEEARAILIELINKSHNENETIIKEKIRVLLNTF
ncbi:MAG: hypothetical protein ACW981_20680 [Candidatus Hodarchaeales archaeon]